MSIFGNDPGTGGLFTNDPNKSSGSGGQDNNLPDPPAAESTTKQYALERELIATQVGFEISFSTNSTGAFDNTKVSGLGYQTTTARTGTSIRFFGTAGRANGEANGYGGADAGAVLYCSATASAGSIEDKIDSWVIVSESEVSLVTVIKVNASTMGVYSKDISETGSLPTLTGGGDDDFGGSIAASSRETTIPEADWNDITSKLDQVSTNETKLNTIPDASSSTGTNQIIQVNTAKDGYELVDKPSGGEGSVSFADVITGGTYGAEGTSTGGGSLETLAVLYDTVQYYRIFAANGLSEILSTSTDETNTSAQIYTRTYEV